MAKLTIHDLMILPLLIAQQQEIALRRESQLNVLVSAFKTTPEVILADFQSTPWSWDTYYGLVLQCGRLHNQTSERMPTSAPQFAPRPPNRKERRAAAAAKRRK